MMERKNIAINALSAVQGGGQGYLFGLLQYAKDFPEMKVYVLAPPKFTQLYHFSGVEVVPCIIASKSILHRTLWERWRLPGILKDLRIDLIFCPGGIINFLPPPGCQTATTFQNMLIFDTNNRRMYPVGYRRFRLALLERISKKSFEEADLLIFLSEYAKEVVHKRISNRKGLSAVIPHGLDDMFRTGTRKDIPRPKLIPNGEYLLYVSYLHRIKAQIEVIRAYYLLSRSRFTKERLLLVGSERPGYGRLIRKEIRRLRLQDKVILTGNIPYIEMPSVYHYAKAHIFASTCENCPNIVLESLGSGRPLFVSNKPPMPELAGDGAVYFDPYKPDELADLLLQYLDDERWIEEMSKKTFERSFLYSWGKVAKETFQAFMTCMQSRQ